MCPSFPIQQMKNNAQVIQHLLHDIAYPQAVWKPEPHQWSLLEVINHLVDEETLDFTTHLREVFEGKSWTSIQPTDWVAAHNYEEKDFNASLQAFLTARELSIQWLSVSCTSWNLNMRIDTPFGSIAAGDILHSWLAHDLLHTRQIIELQYLYAAEQAAPYQLDYAGAW
jgi:hypothetical protein